MTVLIRPARPADQATIRQMVRAARLAPFSLNWQAFWVAETAGALVGVGQIKKHRDGSQELASLAVSSDFHGQGIGSALVHALLETVSGPVYLFCREGLEGFYARFQFRQAGPSELPGTIARLLKIANFGMRLLGRISGRPLRIIAMQRPTEG